MVHQYRNNGYNIVLDVNSGAIHVVDDVTYDVIPLFEAHTTGEIVAALKDKYKEEEIKEACEEVSELKENQELFTPDEYEDYIMDFKKRPTVVKALCLHIAHDCNLACQLLLCRRRRIPWKKSAHVLRSRKKQHWIF